MGGGRSGGKVWGGGARAGRHLKSGMPLGVLMPAPTMTTTLWQALARISSATSCRESFSFALSPPFPETLETPAARRVGGLPPAELTAKGEAGPPSSPGRWSRASRLPPHPPAELATRPSCPQCPPFPAGTSPGLTLKAVLLRAKPFPRVGAVREECHRPGWGGPAPGPPLCGLRLALQSRHTNTDVTHAAARKQR